MDYIDEFLDFGEDQEEKKEAFEMIGKEEFVEVMRHAEGRMEGFAEKEKEIAEGLFKKGTFSIEEIADIVKMPISKVQELKNKLAN